MRHMGQACLGCAAALLLTAPLRAEQPARGDSGGSRATQGDRSRGFWGFPDWDSRSGSYDRSRRADGDDRKTQDSGGGSARTDDRRGPPGGPGGFGPGFGRGGFGRGGFGPGGPPRSGSASGSSTTGTDRPSARLDD